MLRLVEFRGWRFRCDPDRTREAYALSDRLGAEGCTCAPCRNFVAQRTLEFPPELRGFLAEVGVDPWKEAEVWDAPSAEDDHILNVGWWHFVGDLEATGEIPVTLRTVPEGRAKDWRLEFRADETGWKLETFPISPIVEIRFLVVLPWILSARRYEG